MGNNDKKKDLRHYDVARPVHPLDILRKEAQDK